MSHTQRLTWHASLTSITSYWMATACLHQAGGNPDKGYCTFSKSCRSSVWARNKSVVLPRHFGKGSRKPKVAWIISTIKLSGMQVERKYGQPSPTPKERENETCFYYTSMSLEQIVWSDGKNKGFCVKQKNGTGIHDNNSKTLLF